MEMQLLQPRKRKGGEGRKKEREGYESVSKRGEILENNRCIQQFNSIITR